MKCADIDRILDDHHFSRLPRSDQAAVEDHLRQCVRCAPLWQASELLASEVPPAIPASAFDRVLRKIESPAEASLSVAEPVVKRSLLERLAVPVGLAATALIAALVVLQPDPAMRPLGDSAGTLLSREPVDSRSAEAALAAGVPRFVEGQHYFRIADTQVNLPSGDEADFIDVEEFFMYGCPHCYTFEGLFEPWCALQPEYVRVRRVPVIFNPVARLHARAFYAAQLLGIDGAMHAALLAAIHERGESMSTELELAGLAADFGVEAADFLEALGSAAVISLVNDAERLARSYGIRATPSLVVDHRFRILPGSAGSYEEMVEVAGQLIEDAVETQRSPCRTGATDRCDPTLRERR